MPEKPEVITVVESLKPNLIGKKITGCNIYWDNIIAYPISDDFRKQVVGQKINEITTRGKWIVIMLDRDSLLVHLRMEGKFYFRKKGEALSKHEHVEFILDDDISFRFHDVRKFGKMHLVDKKKVYDVEPLNGIGKEFNDETLTKEYLYGAICKKTLPIKTILLDQSIICGIGNIYDDEILFMSKIHPLRKGNEISLEECDTIIKNTRNVLNKAIKLGGTTIKSFTSSEGVHGLFQNELLVHGRGGQKCPICSLVLNKIKVGGRGTHYCENCQK